MINSKNKIGRVLSIRDVSPSLQQQDCKPKENCSLQCSPSCNSSQVCVYKTITECGVCPPTFCMENKQLRATNHTENNSIDDSAASNKRTALIAGLTTGLVVFALIIATVAGFVYYRRRKLRQEEDDFMRNEEYNIKPPPMAYLPPTSNDLKPINTHTSWNQVVNYDDPQSPFIIGAQSLQIPHLNDMTTTTTVTTPDPSNNNNSIIRRSLNIQSTTVPMIDSIGGGLGRASSVKVTKFDKRSLIPSNSEDDLSDITVLRRAISVRKNDNSTTSSMTRVGSDASSQEIIYAKPTMVRINTVLKRDQQSGLVRKTSIRTVIEDNNNDNRRMDFYLCPPPPAVQPSSIVSESNSSQISVQSSTSSHSTFGDGSITVYLEPPPP